MYNLLSKISETDYSSKSQFNYTKQFTNPRPLPCHVGVLNATLIRFAIVLFCFALFVF